MSRFDCGNGSLWLGDCLELMRHIPDASIDMILCDLPYDMTDCKWDSIIPFEPLWREYWRIAKLNAAIVLTAAQPFTTVLIGSQIRHFKYEWIWNKNLPTGFGNAKIQPMRAHENVAVFYRSQPIYNKQPTATRIKDRKLGGSNGTRAAKKAGHVYMRGGLKDTGEEIQLKENVSPRTVLDIDCVPRATGTLHPTQKPIELFEYFIKTYTNAGDLVLDNCSGSGTTAIAAIRTGRRWLCIEKELKYYLGAAGRIWREMQGYEVG